MRRLNWILKKRGPQAYIYSFPFLRHKSTPSASLPWRRHWGRISNLPIANIPMPSPSFDGPATPLSRIPACIPKASIIYPPPHPKRRNLTPLHYHHHHRQSVLPVSPNLEIWSMQPNPIHCNPIYPTTPLKIIIKSSFKIYPKKHDKDPATPLGTSSNQASWLSPIKENKLNNPSPMLHKLAWLSPQKASHSASYSASCIAYPPIPSWKTSYKTSRDILALAMPWSRLSRRRSGVTHWE